MVKLNLNLLTSFLFGLVLHSFCAAQVSESKSRDVVKNVECVKAFVSDTELLRINRKEELEDTLLQLQMAIPKRNYIRTFIYEVSNTGYFWTSAGKLINVSSSHGGGTLLIAVSENSGRVYSLYGCSDREKNFSDLIKQSQIAINTKSEAESLALFRYTMIEDPKNDRFVSHSREMSHKVENFFYTKLPSNEAEKSFKAWIKAYKRIEDKIIWGTHANQITTGFSTSLTYLIGSNDGTLRLRETTMDINRSGEYSAPKDRNILP